MKNCDLTHIFQNRHTFTGRDKNEGWKKIQEDPNIERSEHPYRRGPVKG